MIGYRCKNCTWWDCVHPSVALVKPAMGKTRVGFCRKHKPGAQKIGDHFYGVQPVMDAEEFCGEFRAEQGA